MTDEQLIEAMARRLAKDDGANWEAAHFGETPSGETPEEMRDYYRGLATAALAALRKTHHLIPRAAGDDGELVKRLRLWGEHGLSNTLSDLVEAADRIEALSAEVERLRKENDIRQGRIDRLEKLHSDIIAYAARGDTQ